jgi:nucleoside-diphosphate-sugar epimerase
MRALVIGGTAATGPHIIRELQKRGYDVTIYHRGLHEIPSPDLATIAHIHGEPHFREEIEKDLGDKKWDVVVATYGRLRYLADALVGRTPRLITVGGRAVMKGWIHISDEHWAQHAQEVVNPGPEDTAYEDPGVDHFVDRMIETEQTIMAHHRAGDYVATHFRYATVYGPYGIGEPFEWRIVKRILDGRKRFVIQDGGQNLFTRCAAPNAAYSIALAIDKPEVAGGEIYHIGDNAQYTYKQWVEMIAAAMEHEFEFVNLPFEIVPPGGTVVASGHRYHRLMDTHKIRCQLGYNDAVAPQDWVKHTVRWVLENRPDQKDGYDPGEHFDYEAEDALIAWWQDAVARVPQLAEHRASMRHPYPHPKEPGDLT